MTNVTKVLAIAVLLIGGCMSSRESSSRVGYDFTGVDKVAIVAVEGVLTSEAAKDQIADFFSVELLEKGYAPIGREQVRAQLREQEPKAQNPTVETAVDAGLILDVPAVLAIRVPHFEEEMSITAKMINVEDGSTLWLASGSGRGRKSSSDMFGFGKRGRNDDRLLNDVMKAPMTPGPNLLPLTPDEARNAQAIIKNMCRSLPAQSAPMW